MLNLFWLADVQPMPLRKTFARQYLIPGAWRLLSRVVVLSGRPRYQAWLMLCRNERKKGRLSPLSLFNRIHVFNEFHEFGGVAPFIVVPGDDFHEVVIQSDSGAGIED